MRLRISILFLLVGLGLQAQTVRKYSNEFLNIGVGADAFGMGNAVVATTADVNSGYWNPAGLIGVEDYQISLMHAAYFANIANYDYVGGAMPLDDGKSAVGFSMIRFGVDDIMNTTQLIDDQGNINYDRISLFSAADYGFTFSYARQLPVEGLSFGANAKVIRRIIGSFANSWGFGFDVGVQYQIEKWSFGLMARDVTTTYNTWSIDKNKYADIQNAVEGQNQELPETTEITLPKLQLGAARVFQIGEDWKILGEIDLIARFTQTHDLISTSSFSLTPAGGFQVDYKDMVYLRGGVGNFQNERQFDGSDRLGFQPNFGVGFKYKGIRLDYALTDIGDQSVALYSNVFSLTLDWSVFR